ncbi:[FeFe] hydrogenase H-cluster maturation GTPase HydF [Lachnospiraceae bacterium WCA-9-b2]|mgnify:FL=1|jgi:[FeFe] hydrogenase H-cluster maturation GTPase HydF|uniref:[FeFe] hydrogenase H-cluster maturation GTPase HydF n=2 Tax=Sporofaciens musculi TaxID=2681861 RepID=A0A7X3SKY0_9FIRM|nr:[FeFe] hydrogenase H-cluster maturation GTPase HydF [Sporofaciens musculi]MCI9421515.1 [FeFe] hydrogenase H-cluster maturation GTPase HydF [Dorea sp.]MXP78088.1 [FeFe] hydrogenase H-cluster maturation GTPase HydF [Sporofaciens musculi]
MSLNNTPSSERIHIGIFGKRNAGKSSLINALTGQNLAIVSNVKGTTTDPVPKAMELLPLGPVVMIDTPGLDDDGKLGPLRIQKAYQILNKTDIAVLVVDGTVGMTKEDEAILEKIKDKSISCVIVMNKADLKEHVSTVSPSVDAAIPVIWVSAADYTNISELKDLLASLAPAEDAKHRLVGDLLHPLDLVVLVIPIDKAAPKGRLILPQQQTIRDILESGAVSVVTGNNKLKETLASLGRKPSLVITDSQAFEQVAADVPEDIPLTSFSILFARYKGNLETVVNGAKALYSLNDGDRVLISEGCTHHRQCGDIGTQKLPAWIQKHTGKELHFEFTSGTEFPADLGKYQLIIHCGGCTLNEREMKYRLKCAGDASVPITNYGTVIAYMKNILERSVAIF